MTVRVRESNPGALKKILDRYKKGNVEIAVGLPSGSESAGLKYPDGTDLLDVAYWNEFGSGNIPERPFLRAGVRGNIESINKVAGDAVKAVNAGDLDLDDAGELIGQEAAAGVSEYIIQLSAPPNAPATIQRKGSSNPLVDTGLLHQSITYEVRSKR